MRLLLLALCGFVSWSAGAQEAGSDSLTVADLKANGVQFAAGNRSHHAAAAHINTVIGIDKGLA